MAENKSFGKAVFDGDIRGPLFSGAVPKTEVVDLELSSDRTIEIQQAVTHTVKTIGGTTVSSVIDCQNQ